MKHEALKDFLSILPYLLERFHLPIIELLCLIRISFKGKLLKEITETIYISEKKEASIELITLFSSLLYIAHFGGCVWYFFIIIQPNIEVTETNFLRNNSYDIMYKSWTYHYIYSLYYATVTMLTVGYGDLHPHSIYERSFSNIFMIIACFVFAYLVNSIGQIIEKINKTSQENMKNMSDIKRLMKYKNISKGLQMQIQKFFEYRFLEQENEHIQAKKLIYSNLPSNLKKDLSIEMFKSFIENLPHFKSNFSQNFLLALCEKVQEKSYAPGQILIEEEKNDNIPLSLVLSGSFMIRPKDQTYSNKKIGLIKENECISLSSFLNQKNSNFNFYSNGISKTLYIEFEDFINTTKEFPQDHEKFCELRDEFLFSNNSEFSMHLCYSCSKHHLFKSCPLIFFVKDLANVKMKKLDETKTSRNEFIRKSNFRFQSLKKRILIENRVKSVVISCQDAVKYLQYFSKKILNSMNQITNRLQSNAEELSEIDSSELSFSSNEDLDECINSNEYLSEAEIYDRASQRNRGSNTNIRNDLNPYSNSILELEEENSMLIDNYEESKQGGNLSARRVPSIPNHEPINHGRRLSLSSINKLPSRRLNLRKSTKEEDILSKKYPILSKSRIDINYEFLLDFEKMANCAHYHPERNIQSRLEGRRVSAAVLFRKFSRRAFEQFRSSKLGNLVSSKNFADLKNIKVKKRSSLRKASSVFSRFKTKSKK